MKKTIMTLGIASAMMLPFTSCTQSQRENPLLAESTLPYGAPDFGKIQASDYLPAFEVAMKEKRDNIAKIIESTEEPTFENTILAYEESGTLLDRLVLLIYSIADADKTPEIAEVDKKVRPMMTELENEIAFNKPLFERIRQVYDIQREALQGEDRKLLEEVYKDFVRRGALLNDQQMARVKEINLRLTNLEQEWGDKLVEANNNAIVWVDSKDELAGLSEADIAQCAQDAKERGKKAPYAIVIVNTTPQPLLASLSNRDLRRRIFETSIHRTDGTGQYNLYPLTVEIAKLRAEKAEIMGFHNYAAYSLDNSMAKLPERVNAFLHSLVSQYVVKAQVETQAIQEYARRSEGASFELQPYDRAYYSSKMQQEMLEISDEEVKPYFNIDSVLVNGVFYAANRVYGLNFTERTDIPTYHPDMKVYEVTNREGQPQALFYLDAFRRPTKRGGAWMDCFIQQSRQRHQMTVVYNVHNVAKAPEGQPSLLTWDEVSTMFHEFGHALHAILSDCQYNTLSCTNVPRDFVEMPSQFNESFASIPEVFDHYARHYQTGEPMPAELKERMLQSIHFLPAYNLGETMAAACLDMAWHMLASNEIPAAGDVEAFETNALKQYNMLDAQIPPRYRTSYFNHVWAGGYSAGYYSYLWTEVLAVNVADAFARRGALDPATGKDFADKVLSRGNTGDLMQFFSDFTGLKQPDASGLLKSRGL